MDIFTQAIRQILNAVGFSTNKGHANCKYTRSFPPKQVLLCIQFECALSDILKLEHAIKQLPKVKKLMLIENRDALQPFINSLGLVISQVADYDYHGFPI